MPLRFFTKCCATRVIVFCSVAPCRQRGIDVDAPEAAVERGAAEKMFL